MSIHCNHHVLNLLITTSVTVENLEEKLSSNRDEVDSVYHTLQQQQMEAERKASDEKSEEHSHLQSQIEKLYQENYQLKSEVSPYMSEGCRGVTVNCLKTQYCKRGLDLF